MNILGISAFYHDSAAAIIRDGQIVAAAQEERFTRKKHDHQFPTNSVNYCVEAAGVDPVNFKDFSMLAQEWYLAGANLSGDISGDEFVDMEDLYILAKYWLSNCPPYPEESGGAALRSDINGDQVVNVQDLGTLTKPKN